jgi:hypothetical protein
MPLSDFLSLTDDTLREQFEAKPVDKTAIRKPFKKALGAAIKQFEEGRTKAPNRMWTANGDTVKFTPKLKGQPLAISDKTELFIPSERFVEALNKLIANVDAGELDDLLTEGSTPSAKPKAAAVRASSSDPLTNIRRAFANRIGKKKQTAAEAAAALKEAGKYDAADIDKVLAEKSGK